MKNFRKGAIGALMDEYERAAIELKSTVENLGEEDYERIADAETENEDCRSIQTIMNHVVHSGYGYANAVRRQISMSPEPRERRQISHSEIGSEIDQMLAFTVETLDGKWEISYEEINKIVIESTESFSENLEQLLEHAIVHVLRHRRQIEKFLLQK